TSELSVMCGQWPHQSPPRAHTPCVVPNPDIKPASSHHHPSLQSLGDKTYGIRCNSLR
ncbi:hypothetical protein J6590_030091, partial [Homalodisca vitripennis]